MVEKSTGEDGEVEILRDEAGVLQVVVSEVLQNAGKQVEWKL